jgi:hypothetical protein
LIDIQEDTHDLDRVGFHTHGEFLCGSELHGGGIDNNIRDIYYGND